MAEQISRTNKCIFVHIPKTGGLSLEMTSIFDDQRQFTKEFVGDHTTALEFRRKYPEEFLEYFKFTIVRNPYSRLVSAFNFLSKEGVGNEYDTHIAKQYFQQFQGNFHEFCLQMLTPEFASKIKHLRPQYQFLCDGDEKILVDFVGKQENYLVDTWKIFKKLNLPFEFNYRNISQKKQSIEDYYPPEVKTHVEAVYAKDFQLFGYPTVIPKESPITSYCKDKLFTTIAQSLALKKKVLRKLG
jgi:hypothetical protein